jgi:hypothetical protein
MITLIINQPYVVNELQQKCAVTKLSNVMKCAGTTPAALVINVVN